MTGRSGNSTPSDTLGGGDATVGGGAVAALGAPFGTATEGDFHAHDGSAALEQMALQGRLLARLPSGTVL